MMRRIAVVVWVIVLILSGINISCAKQADSAIPEGFTTFTDEYGVFSISYPEDWTVETSMPGSEIDLSKNREELAIAIESDSPVTLMQAMGTLFVAHDEQEIVPNVLVNAWSPEDFSMSLKQIVDERVESTQQGIASSSFGDVGMTYEIVSETSTTIDGREAYLVEVVYTLPGNYAIADRHYLIIHTLVGKVIISASCAVHPDDYNQSSYDIMYDVVNSLRILK